MKNTDAGRFTEMLCRTVIDAAYVPGQLCVIVTVTAGVRATAMVTHVEDHQIEIFCERTPERQVAIHGKPVAMGHE